MHNTDFHLIHSYKLVTTFFPYFFIFLRLTNLGLPSLVMSSGLQGFRTKSPPSSSLGAKLMLFCKKYESCKCTPKYLVIGNEGALIMVGRLNTKNRLSYPGLLQICEIYQLTVYSRYRCTPDPNLKNVRNSNGNRSRT